MFKFLKDKLKGALSSFSKKAEEVAKEEVEEPSAEISASPDVSPASESRESSPARLEKSVSEDKIDDDAKTSGGEEPTERKEEAPESKEEPADDLLGSGPTEYAQKNDKAEAQAAEEERETEEAAKNIPQITIPIEEKKSFFQRIKSVFVKEETEGAVEEQKQSDIEIIPNEPVKDVIIEEQDLEIEGSPLKKVDIHTHDEHELPVIEKLFEPIEPVEPRKEKKSEENPEDYTPSKIAARIKDIKVRDDDASVSAKPVPTQSSPLRLKTNASKSESTSESKSTEAKIDVKARESAAQAKVTQAKSVQEEKPEKKGFFAKLKEAVTTKKLSDTQFEDLFWDLEVALLENNVAVEVISKLKDDLKQALVDQPIPRGKIEETILATLKASLEDLFAVPQVDLLEAAQKKKPLVICFVGINGSGKTTTIAKVTHLFQQHKLSVVLAAADTFRAAAIDQLQLHADKLGVKLIKHDYGADPAAVAFDAIKHAEAAKKDVVLIDTAGRLHSNINLVDEMKKIVRVAKPDLIIFIGESITGNDCVEQAKQFDAAVGINGIILSKADIDEKGGAAISVSYVTKKPILYLGVGQEYDDLQKFDSARLLESLGL